MPTTVFNVNTTADLYVPPNPATPPAVTSLRYALEQLHIVNDTSVQINLPAGLFQVQLPATGTTDALGNPIDGGFVIAPPAGVSSVTIVGAGMGNTTIDAQNFDRVFTILPQPLAQLTVTFQNLTIEHGSPALPADTGTPPINFPVGGGIFFNDPRTETDVTAPPDGTSPGQNSLVLNRVLVTANAAIEGGGGVATNSANITLIDSAVSGNTSQHFGGGVATLAGNISLLGSSVNANVSGDVAGGIYNAGDNPAASININFDLALQSITVTNQGNNYTSPPTVSIVGGGGSGATAVATVSGNKVTAVNFTNFGSGYTSMPTVVLSGGGGSNASAQVNAAVNSSHVDGNTAGSGGGGIYDSDYTGSFTLIGSTVDNNLTGAPPVVIGVSTIGGGGAGPGSGGGIYTVDQTITIRASNISGNQSAGGGGGLEADLDPNVSTPAATLSIVDTILNGNKAGGSGGAVQNLEASSVFISSTLGATMNNNVSGNVGGAIDDEASTTLQITGYTFVGNSAGNAGGAVYVGNSSNGTMLSGDTFTANRTGDNGGGLASGDGGAVADPFGTTLRISGSSFSSNVAVGSGGGVLADAQVVSVSTSTFVDNHALTGNGGGMESDPYTAGSTTLTTVTITNSIFSLNEADSLLSSGFGGSGGGLEASAGAVVLTNDQFGQNSATGSGGGVSLDGSGTSNFSVNSTQIAGNTSATSGGGLYANLTNPSDVLSFTAANIASNTSTVLGGGIDVNFTSAVSGTGSSALGGTFTFANGTITNNQTSGQGGGIATNALSNTISSSTIGTFTTQPGNTAAQGGGGIAFLTNNQSGPGQVLTVSASTLNGNQAGGAGDGGAILALANANSNLQVLNSTLTGNFAGVNGGGIANEGTTTADLLYDTITSNSAKTGGGIYSGASGSPVHLGNTIVAQNTSGFTEVTFQGITVIVQAPNGMDLFGAFSDTVTLTAVPPTVIGHNLIGIGDASTGIANLVNGDLMGTYSAPLNPGLQPLANNGGPTLTQAPKPTSFAINDAFANLTIFAAAPSDQRGSPVGNPAVINLRPITDIFTVPFSNNPTIGAFQVA